MAAKKSRASKKTSKKSDSVVLELDADTIRTINDAVEALSQFAAAIMTAADDGAPRGSTKKKSAKKSAKKRARKTR